MCECVSVYVCAHIPQDLTLVPPTLLDLHIDCPFLDSSIYIYIYLYPCLFILSIKQISLLSLQVPARMTGQPNAWRTGKS